MAHSGRPTDVRLPVVVEHSAGARGASGPLTTLEHVLASPLSARYRFVRMHQTTGNGGINPALLREWVSLLQRVRPDLVHVRGLQNEGFHGVLAARLARCPRVLVSVHGTTRDLQYPKRSWRRTLLEYVAEPVTLRAATHVTTVCQYAAGRDFLQPHSAKFAGVIPNGVPIAADPQAGRSRCRREIGLNPDDLVMIAVSRLTWEKGFATLAEALPLLRQQRQRCVLLVVGDGSDRPSIENALRSVDTVDVRFLGRRLDVRDLLAAADLFVFATLHENLSNALLEAMARGLPVVASAVGGNIEVLTRGGGILVPPRDPVAFSAAIEHLLTDAAARHEMGEAAREVVANHYSLDAMLDALDRTYQRILADGR